MLKRKKMIAGMVMLAMLTIAGCNTNKSAENIKQGFDAVTRLEYEEALTCFAAAVCDLCGTDGCSCYAAFLRMQSLFFPDGICLAGGFLF